MYTYSIVNTHQEMAKEESTQDGHWKYITEFYDFSGFFKKFFQFFQYFQENV